MIVYIHIDNDTIFKLDFSIHNIEFNYNKILTLITVPSLFTCGAKSHQVFKNIVVLDVEYTGLK